ncbi:MAG: lipopolysaccharide kinase InaA family protein, partial [Planctomycetota bacterium]
MAGSVRGEVRGGLLGRLLEREPEQARIIKRNPRRTVFELPSPFGPLIVKHFRVAGLADALKGLLGRDRARTEWNVARALREAGLPAPEPLVVSARRGAVGFTLLAVRAIPDAVPLGGFLEARFCPGDGRGEEKRPWVRAAVRLLSRLHEAGFEHRDYHGGNLLVSGEGDPESSLTVIDLHRVRIGVRVGTGRRISALADLLHTLRFSLDPEETRFALHEYLAAAGERTARMAAWERRLNCALLERERRRIQSRTKRCVRESSLFEPVRLGGVRGYKRRDVRLEELFAAVESARQALQIGGPDVRSLARRSSVAVADCGARRVAVKLYEQDGFRRGARGRLGKGRAGKAYVAAHGLKVRGVPVPEVVAWLRTPDRAFCVMEEVQEAQPLSVQSFRLLPGEELGSVADQADQAVLRLLCSLFRCGGQVHDLSPKNILVRCGPGLEAGAELCDFDG